MEVMGREKKKNKITTLSPIFFKSVVVILFYFSSQSQPLEYSKEKQGGQSPTQIFRILIQDFSSSNGIQTLLPRGRLQGATRSKVLALVAVADVFGAVSNSTVEVEVNPPGFGNAEQVRNLKSLVDDQYLKRDIAGRASLLIVVSSELLRLDDGRCEGALECSGHGACAEGRCSC